MTTEVSVERDGPKVLLRLESENGLNILSRQTLLSLHRTLISLEQQPGIRALIVTGSGDRAFSAGADLRELAELDETSALEFSHLGQTVTGLLADFPAPVICAVNGLAFGGGLELAIACDFRIASTSATFAYPATKLGILPGFGGTQRCPLLIGSARTKELMFFARTVDAETALQWGLVSAVAPDALSGALSWAQELDDRDPYAIRQIKDCVGMTERADFFFEQEAFANCFRQPGIRERLAAWRASSAL